MAWNIHNEFVVYGLIQICRLYLIALYRSLFLSVGFTKNCWVQIGFHAYIYFRSLLTLVKLSKQIHSRLIIFFLSNYRRRNWLLRLKGLPKVEMRLVHKMCLIVINFMVVLWSKYQYVVDTLQPFLVFFRQQLKF